MEQRISLITLGVSDLEASRHFYETGLGWTVASDETEGIVCFQLDGLVLALNSATDLARDSGLVNTIPGLAMDERPAPIVLAYNTRSREKLDRTINEFVAVGGVVRKPPQDMFWGGYFGCVADPNGHVWEISPNPFSLVTPDGQFLWKG